MSTRERSAVALDRETWIVDAIADDHAAVEVAGERIIHVPLTLLPPGAREGHVLAVSREAVDGRLTITLAIDPVATAAALDSSRQQLLRARGQKDPGGDIAL
ncbi:MAG: hypothetical protein NVS1B4_13420 [Gemmatimonadaceae bacterium]